MPRKRSVKVGFNWCRSGGHTSRCASHDGELSFEWTRHVSGFHLVSPDSESLSGFTTFEANNDNNQDCTRKQESNKLRLFLIQSEDLRKFIPIKL